MFVLTTSTILSTIVVNLHKTAHVTARWKTVLERTVNFLCFQWRKPIESADARAIEKFYKQKRWKKILASENEPSAPARKQSRTATKSDPFPEQDPIFGHGPGNNFYDQLIDYATQQGMSPEAVIGMITHQFQHPPEASRTRRGRRPSATAAAPANRPDEGTSFNYGQFQPQLRPAPFQSHPLFGPLQSGEDLGEVRLRTNAGTVLPDQGVKCRKRPNRDAVKIRTNVGAMRTALRRLLIKLCRKDQRMQVSMQWSVVVYSIDRMFFHAFLVIVLAACCFVLYPRGRHPTVEEFMWNLNETFRHSDSLTELSCNMGSRTLWA